MSLENILKDVKEGRPLYLKPYKEPKVWGVRGIGEYWYGAEKGDKSSIAVSGSSTAPMDEVLSASPQDILGEKPLKKFGEMLPLVKILTPEGRLSVQFHDSKNELWIVTGLDKEVAKGDPEIIVGFSPSSVDKFGDEVTEKYKEALTSYGEILNELIERLEKGPDSHLEVLKHARDAIKAAEYLKNGDEKLASLLGKILAAKEKMESFYNYRKVKIGDVIPIPSGTLHALGAGVEVVEPQIAGPTQSLEDGATYPVRYYFPGYKKEGAKKELDVERASEMHAQVTPETSPEVIREEALVKVERLPGNFEDKGLEVHRITLKEGASLDFDKVSSFHNYVAVKGESNLLIGENSYKIPKASPDGEMLLVPASCRGYKMSASQEAQIIDTFTPV